MTINFCLVPNVTWSRGWVTLQPAAHDLMITSCKRIRSSAFVVVMGSQAHFHKLILSHSKFETIIQQFKPFTNLTLNSGSSLFRIEPATIVGLWVLTIKVPALKHLQLWQYVTFWQKCCVVKVNTSRHREDLLSSSCRVISFWAWSSHLSFSLCIINRSRSASTPSARPPRRATHDFWRTVGWTKDMKKSA